MNELFKHANNYKLQRICMKYVIDIAALQLQRVWNFELFPFWMKNLQLKNHLQTCETSSFSTRSSRAGRS